ncbi:FecR family protein [Flavobacterium akiainvivens]|uniref:FecR family protein n=1 Tax=Flavobacterium akiainvivens TaxID=1202724 RepID=UPI0006C8D5E9|nr:FecR domain-containing protein [Flavobacterium akiainvivens]SFQ33283.1 FecR family protein [Flavobacterium akiainvivens]
MNKDQFIALAEKYARNECTPQEKQLAEQLFDALAENSTANLPLSFYTEKEQQLLNRIHPQLKRRKNRFTHLWRAAAVLVIATGLAVYFLAAQQVEMITCFAGKGQKKELHLPDGSVVVLNANSSLTYPEKFNDTRNVTLTGEGYFKIHRDTLKPFIVAANDVNVRVLGTSFNIDAYKETDTKVSVLTGKVRVSYADGKKIDLVKNEQVACNAAHDFVFTQSDNNNGIAWTQNTIVLEHKTLLETAQILENWYDATIDFEDNSLKGLTISGKFKDEKLDSILVSIAFLKQLTITNPSKNHYVIRKNSTN